MFGASVPERCRIFLRNFCGIEVVLCIQQLMHGAVLSDTSRFLLYFEVVSLGVTTRH